VHEGGLVLKDVISSDLISRAVGISHNEMRSIGTDDFQLDRPRRKFHFTRDPNQVVTGFVLDAGRTQGMFFSRSGSRPAGPEK
jgi:hypothetical protein